MRWQRLPPHLFAFAGAEPRGNASGLASRPQMGTAHSYERKVADAGRGDAGVGRKRDRKWFGMCGRNIFGVCHRTGPVKSQRQNARAKPPRPPRRRPKRISDQNYCSLRRACRGERLQIAGRIPDGCGRPANRRHCWIHTRQDLWILFQAAIIVMRNTPLTRLTTPGKFRRSMDLTFDMVMNNVQARMIFLAGSRTEVRRPTPAAV
jgi:hypothetical protein